MRVNANLSLYANADYQFSVGDTEAANATASAEPLVCDLCGELTCG